LNLYSISVKPVIKYDSQKWRWDDKNVTEAVGMRTLYGLTKLSFQTLRAHVIQRFRQKYDNAIC